MFGKVKKATVARVSEEEIARKLEADEAVRLIKRRIDELDLKKFWLNVGVACRPPACVASN